MSLPLLHAGRTNPGLSAALDLRFALDKSLTAYRGPTPSFSRASTGSYFDGSGVLRYANVNLLTYSENFSDASWTKNSATVTNDSIVSPDGKTTADTLTESSANATHFVNKSSSTSAGTIYTSSIYAKAGTRKYIDVTSVAQDGGIFRRFNNVFDLETGTWQSTASLNSPANTAYSITSVGNGWYRISSSILAYGSTHYLVVYLSNSANPTRDASNDVVYTGNGTGNLYIWGAQLEASSTVGTYCPTTSSANSAPRFNHTYNGTSWVSKGLLVEEQRTNLAIWSEDFTNAAWSKPNVNVSGNAVIAPDGNLTADLVYPVPGSTWAYAGIERNNGGGVAGNPMTISFFFKAAGKSWVSVHHGDGSDAAWFNISTGTIGAIVSGTPSISNVGNGWYKCSITRNISSNGSGWTVFRVCDSDGSTSVTGSGTNGVYAWGAQTENGAFPTSYIPTTTASTTRSADVCQITGSDFSGFWNGTEGTLAFDADGFSTLIDNQFITSVSGGSVSNSINLVRSNANDVTGVGSSVLAGGVLQEAMNAAAGTWPTGLSCKLTFAYKANDFAQSVNGAAVTTDTSGSIPTVSQMVIGNAGWTTGPLNGHIARLRYYRKRLPNATLQLLSEPDPTLNLQFALNKTITPVAGPAPSFSRASTGSYFDSTGTLKYANVNLLTYSEQFDNAAWTDKAGSTLYTNVVASPNGDLSADQLQLSNAGYYYQKKAYTTTGTHTFSVWLRSSSPTTTLLRLSNDSGTENSVATCNVTTSWQRFSVTRNWSANPVNFYAGLDQRTVVGGPGTSTDVYIWGAQLELASSPSQYAKTEASTTAGPRFDHVYSGGQWVSRGLLVEDQRTNICLQSNTFNTTWLTLDGTVTANAATSPDGTNNAWKLNEGSGTTASHGIYQPLTIGTGNYTWSVYAKAGERSWLQFLAYSSSTNYFTWFNLANGTVGTNAAGTTASIQDVGGGWYRCSVSRSTSAGTSYAQIFAANADNNGSYAGDPTKGIYIYGCQVEAGAFPTSYIGTTNSSVVRSADVCQITGTSFNWMWNQGEGSVFTEFDTNAPSVPLATSGFNTQIFAARDSSNNQRIYLGTENFGGRRFYIDDGAGSSSVISPGALIGNGVVNKASVAWKTNDMAASFDGASVLTDNSQIIPLGITAIDFGKSPANTNYLCGHIAKLIYYPARLTNTKLQQLST